MFQHCTNRTVDAAATTLLRRVTTTPTTTQTTWDSATTTVPLTLGTVSETTCEELDWEFKEPQLLPTICGASEVGVGGRCHANQRWSFAFAVSTCYGIGARLCTVARSPSAQFRCVETRVDTS